MNAHPTEKLSEYIDDELAAPERARIESHLSGCPQCARVVDDLRAVVSAARAIEDSPPASDLWPSVARRLEPRNQGPRVVAIDSRHGPRRLSFSIPQLVAASLAVALLSAGAVWMAIRDGGATLRPSATRPVETGAPATAVSDAGGAAPQAFVEYEAAVADLERLLDEISDDIDPEARRAIDRNLAIIDQAIQQTRGALEANPDDIYLNTHLASTMQRKIDVLREATRLARTST